MTNNNDNTPTIGGKWTLTPQEGFRTVFGRYYDDETYVYEEKDGFWHSLTHAENVLGYNKEIGKWTGFFGPGVIFTVDGNGSDKNLTVTQFDEFKKAEGTVIMTWSPS